MYKKDSFHEIVDRVTKTEIDFVHLFSKKVKEDFKYKKNSTLEAASDAVVRFRNSEHPLIHRLNFSAISKDVAMDDDFYKVLKDYKDLYKEDYIRVTLFAGKSSKYLVSKGFEESLTLVMVKDNYHIESHHDETRLSFRNMRNHPDVLENVEKLIRKFLPKYGDEEFVERSINSYFNRILDEKSFNYYACYLNNEIVGFCSTYMNNDVVYISSLYVEEKYRNKGIATALLKYVGNTYKCPLYVHIDEESGLEDFYLKLGFEEIDSFYTYTKYDNNLE